MNADMSYDTKPMPDTKPVPGTEETEETEETKETEETEETARPDYPIPTFDCKAAETYCDENWKGGCIVENAFADDGSAPYFCEGKPWTPASTCEEYADQGGLGGKCCGCKMDDKYRAIQANRREDGSVDWDKAYEMWDSFFAERQAQYRARKAAEAKEEAAAAGLAGEAVAIE